MENVTKSSTYRLSGGTLIWRRYANVNHSRHNTKIQPIVPNFKALGQCGLYLDIHRQKDKVEPT